MVHKGYTRGWSSRQHDSTCVYVNTGLTDVQAESNLDGSTNVECEGHVRHDSEATGVRPWHTIGKGREGRNFPRFLLFKRIAMALLGWVCACAGTWAWVSKNVGDRAVIGLNMVGSSLAIMAAGQPCEHSCH